MQNNQLVSDLINASDDLFDSTDIENLTVCIRVSYAFKEFYKKYRLNQTSDYDIKYICETVRSSLDCFYAIKMTINVVQSIEKSSSDNVLQLGSIEFYEEMDHNFDLLLSSNKTIQIRLSALISLLRMQILFMADKFRVDDVIA
jgi:hypothetical protein